MRDTMILVMADARARRGLLEQFSELGWRVRVAGGAVDEIARVCRESGARLIVLEWLAHPTSGVPDSASSAAAITRLKARVEVPVFAAAADPTAEDVVRAIKAGASDFLVVDAHEQRIAIERLLAAHLELGEERPASSIESRVVGSSRAARLMRSRLHGLATLSGPVLVIGEAGTGRDTVARALHEAGPAPDAPFRRIECARWLPGESPPAEGTLYLDHVDRLSAAGQQFFAHRLRQMKAAGWERGPRVVASAGPAFAMEPAAALVRAATAPEEAMEFDPGLFRELTRFPLELVPLRERLEDVPAIADQIVRRLGAHMHREVRLSAEAHAFLARQGWPGNVQQLARLLERGVAFCASGLIDGGTMEQLVDDFEESLAAIRRKREIAERDELLATLARTGGNISRCAEAMGRSRGAVYRLIEKYGIALPKAMRRRRRRPRAKPATETDATREATVEASVEANTEPDIEAKATG